ncbi:hypothetical protein [Salibacterium qingdaonense]|uniref:Uncharacterized protein n=1 Tax=Salibacterium qingdaonense TaxID=266892 RepID=A0A1I4R4I4_9BACI|nr:hypothetical protein [Salibacterium qingdaonense]SFM47159.1 hypothetical protein SAMN04488054_1622 [Salibacterium qingdaonense]
MKKIMQKLPLCFISLIVTFSFSVPASVSAQSNNDQTSNNNIVLNMTDKNSWEYTEVKDGEKYKIVEEVEPESYEVQSKIYKKDDQGNYKLEIKQTSRINEIQSKQIIKSMEDGKTKTETVDLGTPAKNNTNVNERSDDISVYADELTPWKYTGTNEGDYDVPVDATAGTVASGLAYLIGGWPGMLIGAGTAIVAASIDQAYARWTTWHKNPVGTTILAGIKKKAKIYETSAKVELLEEKTDVDCAEGYDCS